ncbi:T9SS type A sorting domain-containing protein [Bacteroides salyersiae]|uniref:T9SS type A sorting domain-containing protein n=1 Tax=Bacteroides salyersiae TaxID=291644 RepID=UPI001C8B3A40|nr:T9SS type A sorting domain-containing protein [Bacteroides salyersiae]
MRKLFYAVALLLVSANMNAQSYFVDGYNTSFDSWVDVTDAEENVIGVRPAGWVSPSNSNWTSGTNKVAVTFEKAENRDGEADKACKIITTGIVSTWFSWHVGVTQVSSVYAEDYIADPFFIDRGDDFYYTFWAKSDVDGTKMHIGTGQLYNPSNGGDWADVPYVELTTEWKQYGIYVELAKLDLTSFDIQLRSNGVRYIDDLEVGYGEIPEGVSIINVSSEKDDFKVRSIDNGISFEGAAGMVTVFNTLGSMVAQKATDGGADTIGLTDGGLYIVKLQTADGETARKVIVK